MAGLEPIWTAEPDTASRVRGRIEAVLDFAARGWRGGKNPARRCGHLAKLLPARGKTAKVEQHAALPGGELPAVVDLQRQRKGTAARALEFAILTSARTGEVLGTRWPEIDLQQAVWTVPAARMNAGREHRVPPAPAAVALLPPNAPD